MEELRALAEFGDLLELMLRDRLVRGIGDETTLRLLLAETELTFKKALEMATSQELTSKNVQTLKRFQSRVGTSANQVHPVEPVHL